MCKRCKAEYDREHRAANAERISARRRQRRRENIEEARRNGRERSRRLRERDPAAERERVAKWVEENKERHRRVRAKWRDANRESYREMQRRYEQSLDPEERKLRGRLRTRRRRARKQGATGSHTASDVQWRMEVQKRRCYWCKERLGNKHHVDHIIPLVKGGSDGRENICIACPDCNFRKHAKMPEVFAGRLL